MGRSGSKVHTWTEAEEAALVDAVKVCTPLIEHYSRQGYPKKRWWDTVAGRLMPDLQVTGGACERRWDILQSRVSNDAWDAVAEMVGAHKQDTLDAVYDKVCDLDIKIHAINEKIDQIMQAWEI